MEFLKSFGVGLAGLVGLLAFLFVLSLVVDAADEGAWWAQLLIGLLVVVAGSVLLASCGDAVRGVG